MVCQKKKNKESETNQTSMLMSKQDTYMYVTLWQHFHSFNVKEADVQNENMINIDVASI